MGRMDAARPQHLLLVPGLISMPWGRCGPATHQQPSTAGFLLACQTKQRCSEDRFQLERVKTDPISSCCAPRSSPRKLDCKVNSMCASLVGELTCALEKLLASWAIDILASTFTTLLSSLSSIINTSGWEPNADTHKNVSSGTSADCRCVQKGGLFLVCYKFMKLGFFFLTGEHTSVYWL